MNKEQDKQMDVYLEDFKLQSIRFKKLKEKVDDQAYERIMDSNKYGLRDLIIRVILGKEY